MDRNFLLAFLLSTVAIFAYYTLYPPEQPPVESENIQVESTITQEEPEQSVKVVSEATSSELQMPDSKDVARSIVNVESDLYSIKIDSIDGALQQFLLKDYKYATEPHFSVTKFFFSLFSNKKEEVIPFDPERLVNMAGDVSQENVIWKLTTGPDKMPVNYHVGKEFLNVGSQPEILVLKAMLPSGLEVQKLLTFYPESYKMDMEIKVVNRTGKDQGISPRINFGVGGEAIEGETLPQPRMAATFIDEDFEKHDGGDVENTISVNHTRWTGLMNKYFINVVKTNDSSVFNGELSPVDSLFDGDTVAIPRLVYKDDPSRLSKNQEYSRKFQLYIGPKVESRLEKFDYYLPQAMDLGWFEVISRPLLSVLRWLQGYVSNWGIAIVLLTIIVRTGMFPLAFKSMSSMRKMQALNPKIAAMRAKHKNDKEKMNKEIMQFYSQHKVNPMGGCLPMLLQFPIFIALYQALLPAIELRHTPFTLFWMDLSAADYTLILPALMGATMFFQQSLTPMAATMDATQAKMMKWMPVMMVLFFLNMPSGLVLYWVVSNIISVGQQLIFNKVAPPSAVQTVDKTSAKGKQSGKKSKNEKAKGKGK